MPLNPPPRHHVGGSARVERVAKSRKKEAMLVGIGEHLRRVNRPSFRWLAIRLVKRDELQAAVPDTRQEAVDFTR
jgi:hypothetical protein